MQNNEFQNMGDDSPKKNIKIAFLTVFIAVLIFTPNIPSLLLVTIILVLLIFYIKHYYFLENTVQKMYKVYDSILEKQRKFRTDSE